MKDLIKEKLEQQGIILMDLCDPSTKKVAQPLGDYVPFKIIDQTLYLSGQISIKDGVVICGKVGKDLTLEQGVRAAEICAINLLNQCIGALGSLMKIEEVIKLNGFVNVDSDFTQIPQVINGASKIMTLAFGEAGKHARFAIGCHSLPMGAAVEVEALMKIKQAI